MAMKKRVTMKEDMYNAPPKVGAKPRVKKGARAALKQKVAGKGRKG